MSRVRDIAEVGLMIFVQRRRNANNDRIHFHQARVICCRRKAVCASCLNLFRGNPKYVGAAARQRFDLVLVNVKTGYWNVRLEIKKRQRESNVAQTDNCYASLTRFDFALQFSETSSWNSLSTHSFVLSFAF